MKSRIQTFGEGLKINTHTTFLDGEQVDVDEISVDLSNTAGYMSSKIALNNLDAGMALPGQILRMSGDTYQLEWADPIEALFSGDTELRKEYPGLQQAHDKVVESLEEYEMVKKLVQDYDK